MNIAGINSNIVKRSLSGKVVATTTEEIEARRAEVIYKQPISGAEVVDVLKTYYTYLGFDISIEWNKIMILQGGVAVLADDLDSELWTESTEYIPKWAILHFLTQRVDLAIEALGYVLPKFRWRPHQIGEGKRLWKQVQQHGWALVRHMPRTGKTGTVLYALEHSEKSMDVLITTTKNAVKGIKGAEGGWVGFITLAQSAGWCMKHKWNISTPHRVKAYIERVEVEGRPFDLCIIDESHKIYSEAKLVPSRLWLDLRRVTGTSPCMFVTATPHSQNINQLYWQLMLCIYNPFLKDGLSSFKLYFDRYGIAYTQVLGNGVAIPKYDKGKDVEVYEAVGYGIMSLSQEDVGFDESLLPTDHKHYIELTGVTKALFDEYHEKEMININGTMVHTMNASDVDMRLHQLEGGTLKYVDVFSTLDDSGVRIRGIKPKEHNWLIGTDKIDYIKKVWGDVESLVIMYHFVNEGKLLRKHFKNAKIFQGKTHSEGIDLWQYKTVVVYSMDYSVATYVQRRDRQVSLTNRTDPIQVHYLVVRGFTGDEIYESVVERGEDYTYKFYR